MSVLSASVGCVRVRAYGADVGCVCVLSERGSARHSTRPGVVVVWCWQRMKGGRTHSLREMGDGDGCVPGAITSSILDASTFSRLLKNMWWSHTCRTSVCSALPSLLPFPMSCANGIVRERERVSMLSE